MLSGFFGGGGPAAPTPVLLSPLQVCLRRVKSVQDLTARRVLARQAISEVHFTTRQMSGSTAITFEWTMEELSELMLLVATSPKPNDAKLDELPLNSMHTALDQVWRNINGIAPQEATQALELAALDPRADLLRCFMKNRCLVSGKKDDAHPMRIVQDDAACIKAAMDIAGKQLGLSLRATVYLSLIFCRMREDFVLYDNWRMQAIEQAWLAALSTLPATVATAFRTPAAGYHASQLMFAELQKAFLHGYGYGKGFASGFSS